MDQLNCIRTFIEIARTRSFTLAARRRGISRASATKHVAELEKQLGARLLIRNSQFVSLTDAGEKMLEGGVRLLEDLEGLSESIRGETAGLSGIVRVGVPPSFGAHHMTPAIAAFQAEVRDVEVALYLDDGTSKLVREGLDISIRIGEALPNSDELAKLLTFAPQVAVASPDYLAAGPPLHTPMDLVAHRCLVHVLKTPTHSWSFTGPDGTVAAPVDGRFRSNFGDALLAAALLGQGISIHPTYMVREHLMAGTLVRVLPDYEPTRLRIHAVYPQRRFLPARIRLFLDFLKDWLTEHGDRLESPLVRPEGAEAVSRSAG